MKNMHEKNSKSTNKGYQAAVGSALFLSLTAIFIRHLTEVYRLPALILVYWRELFVAVSLAAALLITAKHGVRGLLYVWPLTILLFVDFQGAWNTLRIVLVLLAVAAWFRFIYGSVRDDYARFVDGILFEEGATLKRVL